MIADKENINSDFFNKSLIGTGPNDKNDMVLAFSPQKLPVKKKQGGKKVLKSDSDSIPVLLCAPFQSTLWIGFGCVQLNNTVTKIFELRNENDKISNIRIDDWESTSAAKSGFSVTFGASRTQSIAINAKESVLGYISWTPECDQSVSENAILKLNDRLSLQITLHGIAGTGDVSNNNNVDMLLLFVFFTFVVFCTFLPSFFPSFFPLFSICLADIQIYMYEITLYTHPYIHIQLINRKKRK